MSVKSLAELSAINVVDNFRTNGAVISIYDLGMEACSDIIRRLWHARKLDKDRRSWSASRSDDNPIERLQVEGIETLKLDKEIVAFQGDEFYCWLADIVAAGLEELDLVCRDFDKTVAKAIVKRHKESITIIKRRKRNQEAPPVRPFVPALRTLRVKECREGAPPWQSGPPFFDQLSCMLSIFMNTLMHLEISCNGGFVDTNKVHQLFDAIGTICLEKLYLKKFDFCHPSDFTVTSAMKHLKELKLEQLCGIRDQHVLSYLQMAGLSINHLGIVCCANITDVTPKIIQLHCPNLISLDLSCNAQLTTAGLMLFFATASLTKLQRLSLDYNDAVTDAVVDKIADVAAEQLSYISLYGCKEITDQSLQALASISSLKYVSVHGCNRLKYDDVKDFMTSHDLKDCSVYHQLHPND